jgi:peptide/nickel transport system ATP-binding protein
MGAILPDYHSSAWQHVSLAHPVRLKHHGKGRKGPALFYPMTPLLDVQKLRVSYTARNGQCSTALANVSFALQPGETLGVLGESGSGKSTLAAALLRLLPANGRIERGAICFEGQDLLRATPRELEKIRGGRLALIFQEPSLALHPAIQVAEQVGDVIAAHKSFGRRAVREHARQILAAIFPTEVERIANSYPHQLSGGQRARVLIAQAISCGPSLIVADEPTASLDPEMQQEILALFRALRQKFNLSMIWITHNPLLLEGFADRVLVLYAGRVVETGPVSSVLSSPRHPYTQALLRCLPPSIEGGLANHKECLPVIPGEALVSVAASDGCRCLFEPRCIERMVICTEREPEMIQLSSTHGASCFKHVD